MGKTSCPSGYQENPISLKQETFLLAENSNFLWFCNGKISVLKYKIFPVIGLWVIVIFKMLTHLPAGFCPSVCPQPSSVEHLWQMTSPRPNSSTAVPHKCHKVSSKQNWSLLQFRFQLPSLKWSEGSEKHWIMGKSDWSFLTCKFRSSHLIRDILVSLITHSKRNQPI